MNVVVYPTNFAIATRPNRGQSTWLSEAVNQISRTPLDRRHFVAGFVAC